MQFPGSHKERPLAPAELGRQPVASGCPTLTHADCPGVPLVAARQQTELTLTWAPPLHDGAPSVPPVPPTLNPAAPLLRAPPPAPHLPGSDTHGHCRPPLSQPEPAAPRAGLLVGMLCVVCLPAPCPPAAPQGLPPLPLQAAGPSPPTGWKCAAWAASRAPLATAARARARWTRALSWPTWGRSVAQVGGWEPLGGCLSKAAGLGPGGGGGGTQGTPKQLPWPSSGRPVSLPLKPLNFRLTAGCARTALAVALLRACCCTLTRV